MSQSTSKGRSVLLAGGLAATLAVGFSANTVMAAPTPAPVTNATCPAVPGVSPTAINVGLMTAVTGPAVSSFTGMIEGARLRIAQENAKGGVNGRKLNVTVYDDKADGSTQAQVANKAVQQDNVFGLVQASTADTMFPMLKAANVPVINVLGNVPAAGQDRNVFGGSGAFAPLYSTTTNAKRLADAGATKIAVVNHNSPGAQAAGAGIVATLPLENLTLGIRIADAPIGTYDATSTALRVKNSGADGEYSILTSDGGIAVANAFKQQGVNLKAQLLAGFSDPRVIAQAPAALEGTIGAAFGTVPPQMTTIPAMRTYVNGMKAAGLNPYTASGPIGYASADTFIKGLKLAGKCPTRQGFIDNLRKQTKITGAGLLPAPISYQPGVTPNGDPARCVWFMTVKNGAFVPDAKATCGKLIEISTGKVVRQ